MAITVDSKTLDRGTVKFNWNDTTTKIKTR